MASSIVPPGESPRQSPRIRAREWARLWSAQLTWRQATVLRELAEWTQGDGVCRPITRAVVQRLPSAIKSYYNTLAELQALGLVGTVRSSAPGQRAEFVFRLEQSPDQGSVRPEQSPVSGSEQSLDQGSVPDPFLIDQSDNQSKRELDQTSSSPNVFDDDLDIHQQFPIMLRMLGEQAGIKNPWTAKHQKRAEEMVFAYRDGTQLSADVELAIREAQSRVMQHGGESWEYMLQTTSTVMTQMAADALPKSRESYY